MASFLNRNPTAMRKTLRNKTLPIAILIGGLAFAGPGPALATSTNCIVKQAADAAIQRQIALIDAAKVNPSAFFNGPNSCVAMDLLKRFDLSNLIPDLSGFLTGAAQGLITAAIDAAKRQVCQILDQQLYETIGKINQNMLGFQGTLSGDLYTALNGSISPITMPNMTGLGTYHHVQNTAFGSALNLTPTPAPGTTVPPVTPPVAAIPAGARPGSSVAPATTIPARPATGFGGMFQ